MAKDESLESNKLESSAQPTLVLDSSSLDSSPLDSSRAAESSAQKSQAQADSHTTPSNPAPPSTTPRAQKLIHGAYDLSLGISIVVAILLGLGAGILLQRLTGSAWGLGVGVFWGVGAAILNIYKAYKRTQKSLDELANDPKYSYKKDEQA